MPRDPYTGEHTPQPHGFNFKGDAKTPSGGAKPPEPPKPPKGAVVMDLKEGRRLRDEGALKAEGAVLEKWKDAFLREAYRLIYGGYSFTSEDIILVVGMPPSGHPSAVGAMIRKLAGGKAIMWTGGVIQAKRPQSHAAMLKVWTRAS